MKKRTVKGLALLLCAGLLTGCAGGASHREETAGTEETSVEETATGEVLESGAEETAAEALGLTIRADEEVHEISDLLYGIFFEDINFAADGGLYAEMVQNRSFEFNKLASNDELHAWNVDNTVTATVITDDPEGALNSNNPNYLLLENESGEEGGIANVGFLEGMSITAGANYLVSFYARSTTGYEGAVKAGLYIGETCVSEESFGGVTGEWQKFEGTLTPTEGADQKVTLKLSMGDGSICADMISLFPEDTYKGRENGMRKDLAELLEDLHPAFVRFPGGCVTEGVTLKNAYHWKDSIGVDEEGNPLLFNGTYGDVAARKMGQNIWTDEGASNDRYPSFMSYGLGFYEYFLLAEDIGAVGVPVLNAGLACQGQGTGDGPGIATEGFRKYVQDALDLIEFCKGGADTTWGAVRIAMGHEEPFELVYVCIGNENTGDKYYERYDAFVEALEEAKAERPEIYDGVSFIFSTGFDDGDSGHDGYIAAYAHAEKYLAKNPGLSLTDYAGAIDQHYYNAPGWFLNHVNYYDPENYGREEENLSSYLYGGGIPVFVGEYAGQSNTWKAGLAEAAYMTGLERNGDIVRMAAYAPLFGNTVATHWAPDLIWFNNHQVTPSVNYYVQKLFANHAGTALLGHDLTGATSEEEGLHGMVGVGTWNTSAKFSNVKVVSNETGEVLGEDNFESAESINNWMRISDGNWGVSDGEFVQLSTNTNTNMYNNTGTAAYFGDTSWSDYTYTLDAVKTAGSEGFLIPIAVRGLDDNIFWNIGGWNNTVSCLQIVESGAKSGQVSGTVKDCKIRSNKTYHLKVVVTKDRIQCYIDDKLYVDYAVVAGTDADYYSVVSTDETGDIIIKLVNVTGESAVLPVKIQTESTLASEADLYVAAGKSLAADNILGKEEVVKIEESQLSGVGSQFDYEMPAYSVSVIRVHREK